MWGLNFLKRKSINLKVFKALDLNKLSAQYHLENYQLVDCTVSFNHCLYLLFSKESSMRCPTQKEETNFTYDYVILEFEVDWINQQTLTCTSYHYNRLLMDYHFIRLVQDKIMLVGARCKYTNESEIEQNVLLIDRHNQSVQTYCFGDGIEDVRITREGHIYTSYSDEGIFGRNGWEEPLGKSGLVKWNIHGERLWENSCSNYLIDSCYAIEVDSQDDLWFYYYSDFNLVHLGQKNAQTYNSPILGASSFGISKDLRTILFSGGYTDSSLYQFELDNNKLKNKRKVHFLYENNVLEGPHCTFVNSTIIINHENNLYLTQY